jgi:hypothetical protein
MAANGATLKPRRRWKDLRTCILVLVLDIEPPIIRRDFDEAAALYKVVKSIPNAQG